MGFSRASLYLASSATCIFLCLSAQLRRGVWAVPFFIFRCQVSWGMATLMLVAGEALGIGDPGCSDRWVSWDTGLRHQRGSKARQEWGAGDTLHCCQW